MTDAADPRAFDPAPGVALRIAPGLRRVLAPNPSPMTFRGTNSYLLGMGEVVLIDPGPDLAAHRAALRAALAEGERIALILVTHSHSDHSPLARPLGREWGAPVLAFGPTGAGQSAAMARLAATGGLGGGEGRDAGFAPDRCLADGAQVETPAGPITALHTPGHFGNHLCFGWGEALFSGDLAMGWSTSLVSPPDGEMGAYMASLQRIADLGPRILYPGHGAPVTDPAARLAELLAHRRAREAAILSALGPEPQGVAALTRAVYTDIAPHLLPAAERNVFAHLIDLAARNLAVPEGELRADAPFRRA